MRPTTKVRRRMPVSARYCNSLVKFLRIWNRSGQMWSNGHHSGAPVEVRRAHKTWVSSICQCDPGVRIWGSRSSGVAWAGEKEGAWECHDSRCSRRAQEGWGHGLSTCIHPSIHPIPPPHPYKDRHRFWSGIWWNPEESRGIWWNLEESGGTDRCHSGKPDFLGLPSKALLICGSVSNRRPVTGYSYSYSSTSCGDAWTIYIDIDIHTSNIYIHPQIHRHTNWHMLARERTLYTHKH
jgi:hypothetical protein